MTLSHEVLMHVLNQNLPAHESADLLQKYQRIAREVTERNATIVRIKSDAAAKIKALQDAKLCDHPLTMNHHDPSGGSDMYKECLICGDAINEKPVRFT